MKYILSLLMTLIFLPVEKAWSKSRPMTSLEKDRYCRSGQAPRGFRIRAGYKEALDRYCEQRSQSTFRSAPSAGSNETPVVESNPIAPIMGHDPVSPRQNGRGGENPVTTSRPGDSSPRGGFVTRGSNPCSDQALTAEIPNGASSAPRFPDNQAEYLGYAENQIRSGNIPRHLKNLVPVTMNQGSNSCMGTSGPITLCAMPEPIAIGGANNYAYTPIRYSQAAKIARDFGMILPTEAMVNATLQTPGNVHQVPITRPWYSGKGGDGTMTRPYRFREQSDAITGRLGGSGNGNLVVGTHKDYILRNGIGMNNGTFTQLSLYGWHRNRKPSSRWQPAGIQHGNSHVDYSQVPRFYSQWALVDGRWENLTSLLRQSDCAKTLNAGARVEERITNAFVNPNISTPGGRTPGGGALNTIFADR